MRSEALLFFAVTQLAMLFGFSPAAFAGLVVVAAFAISVKALAEKREFDPVSWATIGAAVACAFFVPWAIETEEASGAEFMVEVKLDGQRVEGRALKWTKQRVMIYGRDGQLWDFHPREGDDFRKTADRYSPLSQAEFRAQLMLEFGKNFDVSGTGNYLVVHPSGQKDRWASRFETIYRAFSHYFSTRGFEIRKPKCPLVAVVFPSQGQFLQYAASHGAPVGSGVLGYYSPQTNRILLYYMGAASEKGDDWRANSETIIHEAAHQAAFNTGVHSRIHMPPRWLAEGLGTMFEAPGVYGSRRHLHLKDRLNRARFKRFKSYLPRRRDGMLAEFIASDRLFQINPDQAYAESWALTFFLAETRPRDYARYMAKTAKGEGGVDASQPARLRVFMDVFGGDLKMLVAQYLRFFRDLTL